MSGSAVPTSLALTCNVGVEPIDLHHLLTQCVPTWCQPHASDRIRHQHQA